MELIVGDGDEDKEGVLLGFHQKSGKELDLKFENAKLPTTIQ